MDIFRVFDVEVTGGEDIAEGAIQRGKSVHGIRRLKQWIWGFRYGEMQATRDCKVEDGYWYDESLCVLV